MLLVRDDWEPEVWAHGVRIRRQRQVPSPTFSDDELDAWLEAQQAGPREPQSGDFVQIRGQVYWIGGSSLTACDPWATLSLTPIELADERVRANYAARRTTSDWYGANCQRDHG